MTITEFLEARIAEDEKLARAFVNELGEATQWRAADIGGELHQVGPRAFGLSSLLATFGVHVEAEFVANWDPTRVLAECAAKRAMLARIPRNSDPYDPGGYTSAHTIRALAAIYADHPDYRQEWAL